MEESRLYVFAYDVSNDTKRARLARVLEREGARVQGSVFELRVAHEKAMSLGDGLKKYLDRGDSLRIYHVPDMALRFSAAYGGTPLPQPGDYLLF